MAGVQVFIMLINTIMKINLSFFNIRLDVWILTVLACPFFFSKCDKDSCQSNLIFKNNASNSIVIAYLANDLNGGCRLDGPTILPGGIYKFIAPSGCWEHDQFDVYIIEASTYDNSQFSECDSLFTDYDILTHWTLSSEELKARNYNLSFP
jgi:hypothetical protein